MKRWVLMVAVVGAAAQGKVKSATPSTPRTSPVLYFSPDSYPPVAIRNGEEGRVVATLSVGPDGTVTDCAIAVSSGSAALDETTCAQARRIAYAPARDRHGRAVAGTARLPVRWVIPRDVPADAVPSAATAPITPP